MKMYVTLTDENFEKEVIESIVPVVVEISAQWSGASVIVKPIIHKMRLKYKNHVKFGKLDFDKECNTVLLYGIDCVPSILIFKNGELKDRINGVFSNSELELLTTKYIKGSCE